MEQCLVLTVGTGTAGKHSNIVHGLIRSVEQIQPWAVCLIPSRSPDSVAVADLVYEDLANRYLQMQWIRSTSEPQSPWFTFSDPDNLWQCWQELNGILQTCMKRYPHTEFILNPTSGTKQMTAAALLSGLDLGLDKICFITGERADGVIKSGTERIKTFSAREYMGEKSAYQAAIAINQGAYQVALSILENYQDWQSDLYHYAKCLQYWYRMDYSNAWSVAQKIKNSSEEWRSLRTFLQRLNSREDKPEHVVDLYLSAQRLVEWGYYEEALARLYRMMEMVAQIRLADHYHICMPYKLSDLPKEMIPLPLWNKFVALRRDDNVLTLGLTTLYQLLGYLNDEIGLRYREDKDLFRKVLSKRNTSYIGHARQPVDQEEVRFLLKQSYFYLSCLSDEVSSWCQQGEWIPAENFIQPLLPITIQQP